MSEMLSMPKDKIRFLLLEGVNQSAIDLIEEAGYTNVTRLPKALEGADLRAALERFTQKAKT